MLPTKIILKNIDIVTTKLRAKNKLCPTFSFTESECIIVVYDATNNVTKTLRYELEALVNDPIYIFDSVMTAINENRNRYKRSEQWQRKNPLH